MRPQTRLFFVLTSAALCASLASRLAQTQTSAFQRITNTPEQALNLNPTMSGDGRHIVFESTENLASDGTNGFHAVRADLDVGATTFAPIAPSRAPAAAVSQDATRIAFASTSDLLPGHNLDGNPEIFLSDNGRLQQLTNSTPDGPAQRVAQGCFAPSISADGRLLAFASNRNLTGANADANLEIFIYDMARHALTQITDTNGIVGSSDAKLSGDGAHLAFLRDQRASADIATTKRDLLLYDLSNGRTRALASDVDALTLTPGRAISDDGTRVIYAAETAPNSSQVFLFDGRNDVVRQLTTLGTRVTEVPLNPTISGDGTRIAFATRRNVIGGNSDGSVELYVIDVPTNHFTRITNAPAGTNATIVSSLNDDGSRVAFNFPRVLSGAVSDSALANNSEIYVASIEARAPFADDLQIKHGATFGHEPAALKAIAPDQIAIAIGHNLALTSAQTHRQTDGSFPRAFGNVTLSVNGRAAELLYVSPTQINFVVPNDTGPGAATVSIRNHDGYESRGTIALLPAAPGIFTEAGDGTGAAIALEAATLLRTPFDPVGEQNRERRLTIFATGVRHANELSVSIDGRALAVETVAPSTDLPGLDEIHVLLTRALRGAGVVPLVVRADGRDANPTTINIGGSRHAASIVLTPTSARLGIGRTLRLHATVLDEAGVEIADAPVTFSSSTPDVARVDEHGVVEALQAGATTVSASIGELSTTVAIQVYPLTLVINEVLADPPDGAVGDANHDGVRSASQDEFIEIVNASERDFDLGGYQLLTRASNGTDTLRHIFTAGTLLSPGTAIVIFGGAQAASFNPNDPVFGGAQVSTASTGGLSLINGGSTVTLTDAGGAVVEQMSYGDDGEPRGDQNQSLTRAPDITGDFALHQQAAQSDGRVFSPGTRLDGTPFNQSAPIARITLEPASAELEVGAQQQFSAHAFDGNGVELTGVLFRWQTSNASLATVDGHGLVRALVAGTVQITAQARNVQSSPAMLTIREPMPVLTRIEVTPATLALPIGVQQQFSARALDQNGREMQGVTFNWASSELSIATITPDGLASTINQGATTISASAQGITGMATLNVSVPVLVINEVLADPPDGAAGDANHDGTRNGTDDEFVELVNSSSAPLDLSGWTLRTRAHTSLSETTRHTFAADTMLAAGDCIVVFGGGSFNPNEPVFGGAQVVAASSGGLALTNSGLTIVVHDQTGRPAAQFSYGTSADDFGGDSVNQSITRAPDIDGAFTRHTSAAGALGRKFSPGTKLDGSFFVPRAGRLTLVTLAPPMASVNAGSTTQFTAQAFDQFGRALPGVAFSFTSTDETVAVIESVATDSDAGRAVATVTARNAGSTQIKATATDGLNGVTSDAASLQVLPRPPLVRRVVVSPAGVMLNRGQTQQFMAQAFDENDQIVPGVSFTWTTDDAQVATISPDGLARGVGLGQINLKANTSDGAGQTVTGQASLNVFAPLVINEILARVPPDNPNTPAIEGDANRDGVRSADDDEFVELLNNSNAPLDLSGIVLSDATSNRFTFPPNTTLEGGYSVIVFGGGAPPALDPAFGGALLFTTGSLGLNDGGDTVTVKLPTTHGDILIATQAYGSGATGAPPAPVDQSLTRAPDAGVGSGGGNFVAHGNAPNASGRVFSPGTRADGTPFGAPTLTRIELAPASAQLDIGAQQSFTAHAFALVNGTETEVANVSFIWDVSDATKATLNPATGAGTNATALAAGTTSVRAQAGGQQATANLIVNPPPPMLTRIVVSPATATVAAGQTQMFTAQGFDQNDQPLNNLTFTWASSSQSVATIDANGLATAINGGTTQIAASAGNVTSQPATLNVASPPMPAAGQVVINEALVSFATSSTQTRNDFVELYNTTGQTLDISGLVISFRPSGNSNTPSMVTLPGATGSLTTLIKPHDYFLIINGASTFGVTKDFDASGTGFNLNDTTGGIKIEIGGLKLDGLTYQGGSTAPNATFVAYGEGTLFTFTSGTTNDLLRSPNAADTNNNATDFRRNGATASVTPKAANPTLP